MRRNLFSLGLMFILTLSTLTAKADLAALDRIQDRAANFAEFYASPLLREEYLLEAQKYFGGAAFFPKQAFDAILDQVSKLTQTDGLIAERVWRKAPLGQTFSLDLGNSVGSPLDAAKWSRFLTTIKERLQTESGAVQDWWTTPEKTKMFTAQVAAAEAEFQDQLGQSGYSKEKLSLLIAKHRALIAALLYFQLERVEIREGLQSPAWETISAVVRKLAKRTNLEWDGTFAATPKLTHHWKAIAPDFVSAFENYAKFAAEPAATPAANRVIAFRAARPFHALFRGLKVKECTAGDVTCLKRLTPRRYGIALLENAWVQFMEENGQASGHLQGVFMSNPRLGAVINMDLMAGQLRERVGEFSIFERWLNEFEKHLAADLRGVVVSEALNANNEKMQEFLHDKKMYRLGQNLGPALGFSVSDADMAYRLSLLGWRIESTHEYGNGLTFDGSDEKSGVFRRLNSKLVESNMVSDQDLDALWADPLVDHHEILFEASRVFQTRLTWTDAERFKANLRSLGLSAHAIDQYFRALRGQSRPDEAAMNDLLRSGYGFIRHGLGGQARGFEMNESLGLLSPDELHGLSQAGEAAQKKAIRGHLQAAREKGTLDRSGQILRYVDRQKQLLPKQLFDRFGQELPSFIPESTKFNLVQLWRLRAKFKTVEADIAIIDAFYQRVPRFALYWLFSPRVKRPTDAYKVALSDAVVRATPYFMAADPSPRQMVRWLKRTYHVETRIAVREKMLLGDLKPAQIQMLFAYELKNRSPKTYREAVQKFFDENWARTMNHAQGYALALAYLPKCWHVQQCVEIREAAVGKAKSAAELLRLYGAFGKVIDGSYAGALRKSLGRHQAEFLALKPSVRLAKVFAGLTPGHSLLVQRYIVEQSLAHPWQKLLGVLVPDFAMPCAALLRSAKKVN